MPVALDLFAGAGGAGLGLDRAGFDVVHIERDSDACATLRAAGFANVVEADVQAVDWRPWRNPALLWSSFPCQCWSTAGKRLGARAEVLDLARRWHEAGAVVAISEAEPLDLPGWWHVEITGARVGQRRTFGGTREWVTLNRPPAWKPACQEGLFGTLDIDTGRR